MAVLEAAGAGLPIVLRDLREYDDTFRGDALMGSEVDEFVRIISKLAADKKYYAKAVKGAEQIAGRFDSGAMAKNLVGYYKELARNDE